MQKIDFEPFKRSNIVSEDLLKLMKKQCEGYRSAPLNIEDEHLKFDNGEGPMGFNRRYVHEDSFMKMIHHEIIHPIAEKHFGRKLIPSYVFLSMYNKGEGSCPVHTDRPQCKYTVDLVINQKEPWPFFAGFKKETAKELLAEINEAMFLSGTDHVHWRPQIQKENEVDVVFFHFVDPDFKGDLK